MRSTFLCLFFACFTLACEYTPSGVYEKEVSPNIPTHVTSQFAIDLMSVGDTVKIGGQNLYTYSVNTGGLRTYEVRLLIDGELRDTRYENRGSFYLGPGPISHGWGFMSNGKHVLSLEVLAHSNTGSLADKLGAEAVVFSRSWLVIVDGDPPQPLAFRSASEHEGTFKVAWEKYSRVNFAAYRLEKQVNPPWGQTYYYTIHQQDTPYFIDSAYVGGQVNYRIMVITLNGEYAQSEPLLHHTPLPSIQTIETLGDSAMRISWTKCRFPGNFSGYQLQEGPRYSFGYYSQKLYESQELNDTVFTYRMPLFGDHRQLVMTTEVKSKNYTVDPLAYQHIQPYFFGEAFDDHMSIQFDAATGRLHYRNAGTLFSYGTTEKELLASREVVSSIEYFLFAKDVGGTTVVVALPDKLLFLDPVRLITQKEVQLSGITGTSNPLQQLALSSRGILAFTLRVNAFDSRLILYDWRQERVVSDIVWRGDAADLTFSPGGTYLTFADRLYTLTPEGLSDPRFIREGSGLKAFSPHDENTLYFIQQVEQGRASIKRFHSGTLELMETRSIASPIENGAASIGFTMVDPATGYLAGTANFGTYFYVYDYQADVFRRVVHVLPQVTGWSYDAYHLFNNRLYSTHGMMLPLTLLP